VGHYEDTFEYHNGAWLLARRVTVLPFGGGTPVFDQDSPSSA
jgi:hypothetical protein